MLDDTIIAISTPFGFGGLGVVRLSGRKSLSITKRIFRPKKGERKIPVGHSILGNLYDFDRKEIFEEAYLTFFPASHSYTREDVVEISCHGSPIVLEEVIRLGIKAGARHAQRGEFTLRAYLHGRIDILQAEAINDLIQATSLRQAKISFNQLEGSLSKKLNILRNQIIHLSSQIEASLEFPDEGLRISSKQISKTMSNAINTVKSLIDSYNLGKTLRKGISLAITGKTNVGKSTLFNLLLEKERAIVTPYPGTTRDYLCEKIKIQDSIFTLIDMAGMYNTAHPAEKEGIKRGKKISSEADGILLLLDSSRTESKEDIKLIDRYKTKKVLLLFNKIDLPQKMNRKRVRTKYKNLPSLDISALKGTNLLKLKEKIHEFFSPAQKGDEEVIFHLHQKLLLEDILDSLSEGFRLLKEKYPAEIYIEEIRKSIPLIGELTGEIQTDEVIEDIFSRFCVGK